jgi:ferredoxin-nitrite reductase
MVEGYDITVGGSQGADPQIASLERKGVPASEVKEVIRELLIRSHGARPRARP